HDSHPAERESPQCCCFPASPLSFPLATAATECYGDPPSCPDLLHPRQLALKNQNQFSSNNIVDVQSLRSHHTHIRKIARSLSQSSMPGTCHNQGIGPGTQFGQHL